MAAIHSIKDKAAGIDRRLSSGSQETLPRTESG